MARILVVDDEPAFVFLLEQILAEGGYRDVRSTTDPRRAAGLYREFQPDLILLDLGMRAMDGFAVMQELAPLIPAGAYVPILVLTADTSPQTKRRALASGARDFLVKPVDRVEVLLRIRNLLQTRLLHLELQAQNRVLEDRVRERTLALQEANRALQEANRELEQTRLEALSILARAAEFRDDVTGRHTYRVGRLSALIARAVGLDERDAELLRRAAPLHDIGKLGIPDAVLLKPGPLTREERRVMESHTIIGAEILGPSTSHLFRVAEEIALSHHERWDGRGYPRGLAGDRIPLAGRIVAVVDVFDALTHDRPYKPAWSLERAAEELERQRGRQFDPEVVDAFLHLAPSLTATIEQVSREDARAD